MNISNTRKKTLSSLVIIFTLVSVIFLSLIVPIKSMALSSEGSSFELRMITNSKMEEYYNLDDFSIYANNPTCDVANFSIEGPYVGYGGFVLLLEVSINGEWAVVDVQRGVEYTHFVSLVGPDLGYGETMKYRIATSPYDDMAGLEYIASGVAKRPNLSQCN